MDPKERASPIFEFSDPRQRRIYKELQEVIGPGPAAFFRDACWLMANTENLLSTGHLVAHLMREIESAIREVLQPVVESASEVNFADMGQKEQIKLILSVIGIEENAPAAQAWLKLAGELQGLAHRRGLDEPRSPERIRKHWERFQTLLEVVLRAIREHFLAWVQILDDILAQEYPTKEAAQLLRHKIPNNEITRRYLFERLKNPEWLKPLWKRGFFTKPSRPEARYLARMAKHKPELVAEIILHMEDTEDPVVISELLDALLAMPPDIAARLTEKVKRWCEASPFFLILPEKIGELMVHLAKGSKVQEALEIAGALLDVFPAPEQPSEEEEEWTPPPEPRTRFAEWDYAQILAQYYPDMVRQAGLPALKLLCELLDKAIQFSRSPGDEGTEDYSSIWRPAIESHSQNLGHSIENALVSAVRDAAELIVGSGQGTVEEVIGLLESRPWKVFQRLALHILKTFPDQSEALAIARLTERSFFDDQSLRYEYQRLLQTFSPRLPETARAQILEWIERADEVKRWLQWQAQATGQAPSEEEAARYYELWQRDWLAIIGPEHLPPEWQKRFHLLVEKHGPPKPIRPAIEVETGFIELTSPKTAEEIKSMSLEDLIEFLKTWKPPEEGIFGPSPRGLERELMHAVTADPERFAAGAEAFQGVDPTYVRALLSGLREALKQGKAFDWVPVLKLCGWVVAQPTEIPGRQVSEISADPDWGATRKTIAYLLTLGFGNHPGAIPFELRQQVWEVLRPLTEDPDPTPNDEQRDYEGNMDPVTLAINTVRGQALEAVIQYALWVRRHFEKAPDAETRLQRGFDEMPEVRGVLEAHLDPSREPSWAVRSVYGRWFPWLALLDPEWARTHASAIFPHDNEPLFEAAWNSYVISCRAYDGVLDMLRPHYQFAVEHIGARKVSLPWLEDPDENLAEHLMVFYWRGRLSLEDPLFTTFWQQATDNLRAHAIAFIGRALKQTEEEIPQEILERLKRLWAWRLAAVQEAQDASSHEKEMAAFGWWFVSAKFDPEWALEQLCISLQIAGKTAPVHLVLEQLAKTAETHPLKSVECLRLVAASDAEGWELYARRDHIRQVLLWALRSPEARQEAERVIHYLGSRGFLEYGELLK